MFLTAGNSVCFVILCPQLKYHTRKLFLFTIFITIANLISVCKHSRKILTFAVSCFIPDPGALGLSSMHMETKLLKIIDG